MGRHTTGKKKVAVLRGHENFRMNSAAFSPDGSRIVTASWDKTARVWDATTGKEVAVFARPRELPEFSGLQPRGRASLRRHLTTPRASGTQRPARRVAVLRGHEGDCKFCCLQSGWVARRYGFVRDKTARIWDATTGKEVAVLRGHEGAVNSAAFRPDGRRVSSPHQMTKLRAPGTS